MGSMLTANDRRESRHDIPMKKKEYRRRDADVIGERASERDDRKGDGESEREGERER